jgi:hypothetical protein
MTGSWDYFWSWPTLPVINTQIFNRVRGVTWKLDRNEMESALVQKSQNGRVIRVNNWPQPLWQFVWRWGYVKDGFGPNLVGNVYTDLKTLWGQILPLHGQAGDFLYQPDDSNVQNQQLIVDSNGNAEIVHDIGGYLESVQYLTLLYVRFNGVLQPTPSVAAPSTVPPYLGYVIQGVPSNTVVTVDFVYFYKCMLSTPDRKFQNIMQGIWDFKELPFEQIRV